jgi:hypothetical protein
MNIKLAGYGLAGIGILGILISSKKIMESIPFLNGISPKFILVPGVILVGVGLIFVMSQSSGGKGKHAYSHKTKMGEEIPIFKGKEIVGYRISHKD